MNYETTTNCQGVAKQFKMWYKGFCVDNNLHMCLLNLTQSHPVLVVPRSFSIHVLEIFHDNVEVGHPREIETSLYVNCSGFSMRWNIARYVRM